MINQKFGVNLTIYYLHCGAVLNIDCTFQCSALQCRKYTVHFKPLQSIPVQCNAVQCSAVVQCSINPLQCSAVELRNIVHCSGVQFNATAVQNIYTFQSSAVQCNAIAMQNIYNTLPCSAIQCIFRAEYLCIAVQCKQ